MLVVILPPALFLGFACVRLDAQGAYYDELHQAAGAFTYVGSPPEYFARSTVHGIPLLNMPYSGAIKTAVYGVYLRYVTPEFGIVSWRLVGASFVAAGLVVFAWLARAKLSLVPLALVLALLITDQTVLLGVRHDWGPIALALALRLTLIGVWLRGEAGERPSTSSSFALGFLVGLMTFEKLSSWVMVIALAAMILSGRRRTRRHLLALCGGIVLGALPLIAVNLSSLLAQGGLVSLSHAGPGPERSWWAFLRHARGYSGLAAGEYVRHFILGSVPPFLVRTAEPWLMILAVMLAGAVAVGRRRDSSARVALAALAAYAGIGLALYLFPRRTGVHHWVLGTPFQYVAIGLALQARTRAFAPASARAMAAALALPIIVGVLLIARIAGVISLEQALWRGDASRGWHASLTELGRFAAARRDEAVFVAADWGVATQIYCLSNGRPGLVHEPFWAYRGPADLLQLQQRSGTHILYAVSLAPPSRVMPAATERIFHDLATTPDWRETPVEPEASRLTAATVRKFLYDPPP